MHAGDFSPPFKIILFMTCLPVTVGVNNALAEQNPGRQDGQREDGEGSASESVSQAVPQAPGALSHLISLGMFVYDDP